MQPVAKFLVEDSFHLFRRGIVLAGQIVEGKINTGNFIHINSDHIIQIKGIDIGHKQKAHFVGLRIGDAIIAESILNQIKGQVLNIVVRETQKSRS